MKRIAILTTLSVLVVQTASAGVFTCERFLNEYGKWADRNCVWHPDENPNIGNPPSDGDIKRIQKLQDGRIFIERYGREGQEEEWKETSKDEWSRVR